MIFQTDRCYIRKLTIADFDGLFELHNDPQVMLHTSGDVQNEEECLADLNHVIDQYVKAIPSLLVYAIENKQKKFLGTCAIVRESNNELEIGYRLCRRFWGEGYATEVTKNLVYYCADTFKEDAIYAYCYEANKGSIRVLEKSGFLLIDEFINPEDGLPDRKYCVKTN